MACLRVHFRKLVYPWTDIGLNPRHQTLTAGPITAQWPAPACTSASWSTLGQTSAWATAPTLTPAATCAHASTCTTSWIPLPMFRSSRQSSRRRVYQSECVDKIQVLLKLSYSSLVTICVSAAVCLIPCFGSAYVSFALYPLIAVECLTGISRYPLLTCSFPTPAVHVPCLNYFLVLTVQCFCAAALSIIFVLQLCLPCVCTSRRSMTHSGSGAAYSHILTPYGWCSLQFMHNHTSCTSVPAVYCFAGTSRCFKDSQWLTCNLLSRLDSTWSGVLCSLCLHI